MTSTAIASNATTAEALVAVENFVSADHDAVNSQLDKLEGEYDVVLQAASIKGTMKDKGFTANDLWMVDPREIRVLPGFNTRVVNNSYRAVVRSIADSIKANGYYKECPLAGYTAIEDGKQVIYMYGGHRRLEACMLAISEGYQLERVSMTVDMKGLSLEDMTVALYQGNREAALTFYETGLTCKRLLQMGVSMQEISRRLSMETQAIEKRLKLMSAPLKLRQMVANELMSADLALQMMDMYGNEVVAMAEAAKGRAEALGKTKVTKSHLDLSPYTKVVKKASNELYEVAGKIQKDKAYSSLSAETRALLDGLLAEIQKKAEAKAAAAAKDAQEATSSQDEQDEEGGDTNTTQDEASNASA